MKNHQKYVKNHKNTTGNTSKPIKKRKKPSKFTENN